MSQIFECPFYDIHRRFGIPWLKLILSIMVMWITTILAFVSGLETLAFEPLAAD